MKKKRNISLDQLKFQENQVPSSVAREELYSKIYKRHKILFSKGIFQSQFSSEDITYSLPGKQKTRLHSFQLLCNPTWKDVKMPGVILNTSKSF